MEKPILTLFTLITLFCTTLFLPVSESQTPAPNGSWSLLRSSIGISAMHMQLLRNNKVVMFDRTDFGPSNLSLPAGHCRVDPTDVALKTDCTAHSLFYDISSNSVRPLTVQTDTWCSSGSVLPDGILVQSGGYSDGERVVRTLAPCDDDSCDWVEFPGYLNVRRWYATNQILPDGRMIIVGGRRQFSYEFYPKDSGDSSPENYQLDFLQETRDYEEENNLYPFLHLLPDGNLFVFANTRSILLNYAANEVIREFPPIPGGDPRNYPSSGSSVLLPLHLIGQDCHVAEAEVMVCGGSPHGAFREAQSGTYARAVNTCCRLVVTDPYATWTIEDMPIPRVMGDMLLLPTGDVLIINGARNGTAGWGLAQDPVTTPVIYQTHEPENRRFRVLNGSPKPRLYHSSAVLIPDGRILVGGSNPQVFYNFTGVEYPTDLSIEAFSPPYLAERYTANRPMIISRTPDEFLSYRQSFSVNFFLTGYRAPLRISVTLLAPSFTTHSLGMNQRLLVLKVANVSHVSPFMFQVSVLGPPTARIAPPGYYLLFVVHAGVPSHGIWLKIQ